VNELKDIEEITKYISLTNRDYLSAVSSSGLNENIKSISFRKAILIKDMFKDLDKTKLALVLVEVNKIFDDNDNDIIGKLEGLELALNAGVNLIENLEELKKVNDLINTLMKYFVSPFWITVDVEEPERGFLAQAKETVLKAGAKMADTFSSDNEKTYQIL
jgi:hypothetical protein